MEAYCGILPVLNHHVWCNTITTNHYAKLARNFVLTISSMYENNFILIIQLNYSKTFYFCTTFIILLMVLVKA